MKILPGITEQNPITVDNYPWGFRLKTKKRYWIETTKNGDRFVSQTLDPRTDRWCKPKKSTYAAIMVMVQNEETGHYSYIGVSLGWDNEEKFRSFIERIGGVDNLSELQKQKAIKGIAISKVQSHLTYVIEPAKQLTPEQQAQEKVEREQTENNITKLGNYYLRHTTL